MLKVTHVFNIFFSKRLLYNVLTTSNGVRSLNLDKAQNNQLVNTILGTQISFKRVS